MYSSRTCWFFFFFTAPLARNNLAQFGSSRGSQHVDVRGKYVPLSGGYLPTYRDVHERGFLEVTYLRRDTVESMGLGGCLWPLRCYLLG